MGFLGLKLRQLVTFYIKLDKGTGGQRRNYCHKLLNKMQPEPEVVSREFVKPSPLSNYPKIHNLSFFDTISNLAFYTPLLYFYTTTADNHTCTVLKTSLSAALSCYYPLAGRPKDNLTIDCNDEGALFIESKLGCGLSEFLKNPDSEILNLLIPDNLAYQDSSQTSPLAVQVTYFHCGGMSIGICISHQILDMKGMSTFIKDWASLARNPDKEIHSEFNIGSLYPPLDLPIQQEKQEPPPLDLPIQQEKQEPPLEVKNLVYRRVVFHGSKIAKLKEIVADQVPNPTRVEVVASLLYKSAIFANAKATSSGSLVPSFMSQGMRLHTKVSPPLSQGSRGNMLAMFFVLSGRDKREVELGYLVKEFRKAKIELSNSCANISKEDVCALTLENMKCLCVYLNERQMYGFTSWCWFPFYESDFGWGKPFWVATIPLKQITKNMFILKDTREGDGIEALIYLEEKAMAIIENDRELVSFCCFSPSVLDSDSDSDSCV